MVRVIKYTKCGKKNCICHTKGRLHGPYIYERYKDRNGKEHFKYLGKALPKQVADIRREREWKHLNYPSTGK